MAEMNEQEQQSKEPIRSDMIVRDVILAHPDACRHGLHQLPGGSDGESGRCLHGTWSGW